MGYRLIVIEAMFARRPEIAIRVHKAQTFRSVEIKEGRSLVTDAALSRRTSAKPRAGAHVAPKIRDSQAPPTWILWSERGVRGGGGGISAGGTRSRSRLAGGSGAPWLDRARPNAAPARRRSAIARESSKGWRARVGAPDAPPLDLSAETRRTREDVSPENMNALSTDRGPKDAPCQPLIRENAPHGTTFFFATGAPTAGSPRRPRVHRSAQIRTPLEGRYGLDGIRATRAAAARQTPTRTLRHWKRAPCARQRYRGSVSNLTHFADACAPCLLSTRRHDPDPWRTSRFAALPINAQSRDANCPRDACPRAIRMTT